MATKKTKKKARVMSKEKAKEIAQWMIDNDATCREAAQHFEFQKSSINKNLNKFDFGKRMNKKIETMFKRHKTATYYAFKASKTATSDSV